MFALAACATKDGARITNSMATPLHDLNLMTPEIPAVLVAARKKPYVLPADDTCIALNAEVKKLDFELGPDIDAVTADGGAIEVVGDAAYGAFQGMIEGVVPFRSWVRRLTGAERHSREVAAATAAGIARRAFLKGVARAHGCAVPDQPAVEPAIAKDRKE
jgi:hypothetical protein